MSNCLVSIASISFGKKFSDVGHTSGGGREASHVVILNAEPTVAEMTAFRALGGRKGTRIGIITSRRP